MPKRTWPQHCCVILLNEIEPRVKRYGLRLNDGALHQAAAIAWVEYNGETTRKQTREMLDSLFGSLAA